MRQLACDIVKYIPLHSNVYKSFSFMCGVLSRMNKHSLHNSMAFRTRQVLIRKVATMRPMEMVFIISTMPLMSRTSVKIIRDSPFIFVLHLLEKYPRNDIIYVYCVSLPLLVKCTVYKLSTWNGLRLSESLFCYQQRNSSQQNVLGT